MIYAISYITILSGIWFIYNDIPFSILRALSDTITWASLFFVIGLRLWYAAYNHKNVANALVSTYILWGFFACTGILSYSGTLCILRRIYMYLSTTDAAILLSTMSSVIIPFIYSWMKSNIFPDWAKFLIVCVTCGVTGFLTSYIGGQFVTGLSVIQQGAIVGVSGVAIYGTVFKSLGLEHVLFPRASIISEATKSVTAQIGLMSKDTIKAASNPESMTTIRVSAERHDDTEIQKTSVVPAG